MKFKLLVMTMLLATVSMSYADINQGQKIEICAKERGMYQWGSAYRYNALLTNSQQMNESFGRDAFPMSNYLIFEGNDSTEEDSKFQVVKLTTVLTFSYQEAENLDGTRWLVAKKSPNQICR
ncbi:hypothetical protein [Moraxella cuniculi]|uniref:Secreted protein n=1 Tax=Moraxella cuniculi TaxID=34061 RepID=A0A448GXE3_9GAMM|nr:hypothetical protein [Moraxella cuniculi]VEG13504.1 Uncharacterised protein [Moraxella cuniculi]